MVGGVAVLLPSYRGGELLALEVLVVLPPYGGGELLEVTLLPPADMETED